MAPSIPSRVRFPVANGAKMPDISPIPRDLVAAVSRTPPVGVTWAFTRSPGFAPSASKISFFRVIWPFAVIVSSVMVLLR
jgi:hypothetical protein